MVGRWRKTIVARNDEQGLPPWLAGLIAAILIGAVIWQVVPRGILYASLAIATVAVLGIAYLVYRKRGSSPFKAFGKGIWRAITGQGARKHTKGVSLPPLGEDDAARLITAVGRCERPNCPDPHSPSLVVHHITPQHEDGSSHRLSNLLVLCQNCHYEADRGVPGKAQQRQWARKPRRFTYDLSRHWRYGPG